MVVVEHQPRALLVGVVEGQRAGARVVGRPGGARRDHLVRGRVEPHVRHELHADAALVGRRVGAGSGPLVGSAVADPRGGAAVQVQRGAILRVVAPGVAERPHAGAHQGRVDRQEQVGVRGQVVRELHPHRMVADCHDRRPQVLRRGDGVDLGIGAVQDRAAIRIREGDVLALACVRRRLDLHVAAQRRRREVAAQLLLVLHEADLVVVGSREGRRVGDCDRDVLAETVLARRAEARQGIDELADAALQLGAVE